MAAPPGGLGLSGGPTPAEFFARAARAHGGAAARREPFTRDVAVGRWRVRFEFAGPDLVVPLTRALDHLRLDEQDVGQGEAPAPDLIVLAWTGPAPLQADAGRWEMGPNGSVLSLSDERFATHWMFTAGGLQMLDRRDGRALYWVHDAQDLPDWEVGAPLRFLFDVWLADRGCLLTHAAAIGDGRGAILLSGPGGTGKSSVALAALASGLDYLGDDYVLVDPAAGTVHSLYASGKVDAQGLDRLPWLRDHVADPSEGAADDKALVFVHEAFPHRVRSGPLPVRAVVHPVVQSAGAPAGGPADRDDDLEPVSQASVLRALAASTILQSARPRAEILHVLAAFVRPLTAWTLRVPHGGRPHLPALEGCLPEHQPRPRQRVSVVVPCFDPGLHLDMALASVRAQDVTRRGRVEVIIVDDGSNQDIGPIVERFVDVLDIRIERQQQQGPSAARNRGVALAGGDVIAFLDADDVWPAGSLDARLAHLDRDEDIDVVHGRLRNLVRDDERCQTEFGRPRRSFNLGSMLFRRRVFEHAGTLDESLHHSEDVEYLVRLAQRGRRRLVVDDVCLYYRRHGDGITGPLRPDERTRAHLSSWARILQRSLDRRRS